MEKSKLTLTKNESNAVAIKVVHPLTKEDITLLKLKELDRRIEELEELQRRTSERLLKLVQAGRPIPASLGSEAPS